MIFFARGQVNCAVVLGVLGALMTWFVPDVVARLKVPDPLVSVGPARLYAAWAVSAGIGLFIGVVVRALQVRLGSAGNGALSPSRRGGERVPAEPVTVVMPLLTAAALAVGVVGAQVVVESTVSPEVLLHAGLVSIGVMLPFVGGRGRMSALGGQSWRSRGTRLTDGLRY